MSGYFKPCPEYPCQRIAWVVKVATQGDEHPELKAWRVKISPGDTEDDMKHLNGLTTCPHCGGDLTGGNL